MIISDSWRLDYMFSDGSNEDLDKRLTDLLVPSSCFQVELNTNMNACIIDLCFGWCVRTGLFGMV